MSYITIHADVFKTETHRHSIYIAETRHRAQVVITYENGKYKSHCYYEENACNIKYRDTEGKSITELRIDPMIRLELEAEVLALVNRHLNPPVQPLVKVGNDEPL